MKEDQYHLNYVKNFTIQTEPDVLCFNHQEKRKASEG